MMACRIWNSCSHSLASSSPVQAELSIPSMWEILDDSQYFADDRVIREWEVSLSNNPSDSIMLGSPIFELITPSGVVLSEWSYKTNDTPSVTYTSSGDITEMMIRASFDVLNLDVVSIDDAIWASKAQLTLLRWAIVENKLNCLFTTTSFPLPEKLDSGTLLLKCTKRLNETNNFQIPLDFVVAN